MGDSGQATKEKIAEVFARAAPGYARIKYFWPLGRRLVEKAALPAGARLLDVACGRGAVLFAAVDAVGPTGEVIGIDISGPMAEETDAEIRRRNIPNAHARRMDAEKLDFPDACFDFVTCGFSLAFFPHLQAALGEFRRVLKPGGRAAATTWGGDEDPRWSWYGDLCAATVPPVKLMSQSLDTPAEIHATFEQAGFTGIDVSTEQFDMVYESEDEWWNMRWSISGRATLEQMPPDVLARFRNEAFTRLQAIKEPDGFHELLQVHYLTATAP
jgi:ubiquinone/menaquinone biosynthesis C-methylase UbiE